MSSATVLFVLKHILDLAARRDGDERICSMAFGPGLTVETGLFTKLRQPRAGRIPAEPACRWQAEPAAGSLHRPELRVVADAATRRRCR